MAKTIIVHDPYRNKPTTITEFPKAEGVPRHSVSHYFWYHNGTLEGFRDRPLQGNGIKPHTYTKDGKFVSAGEAHTLTLGGGTALLYWRNRGVTDIDEINRRQREKQENRRRASLHIADDGKEYTPAEYAKAQGVPICTVAQWLRHHNGSLKGFTTRKGSRVNPTKYPHTGLGVNKTVREWAKHFGVSEETIKGYLYTHGRTMDGYKSRTMKRYAYMGKRLTVHAWAIELGIDYRKINRYLKRHNGSLEGIETVRYSRQGNPPKIYVERDGEKHTLREWATILNIPVMTVRSYWYCHHTLDGVENRRQYKWH